jgi:deoxyribodipyrimidine photo-lyase
MANSTAIVWYRNDLRLHDHIPLTQALNRFDIVVPVYCFDPRDFEKNSVKLPKTGPFRAKFLIETVSDLRGSFRKIGGDLVIRVGRPEVEIAKIAKQLKTSDVYAYETVPRDEYKSETGLKNFLGKRKLRLFSGNTLVGSDELPFKITDLPEVFTEFRKHIESVDEISSPLPAPNKMPALPSSLDTGSLPDLKTFGLNEVSEDERAVIKFRGGETEALERVNDYIWNDHALNDYKDTRNQLLGENYSSKLSAWLANGSLSARFVYKQIKEFEKKFAQNDSTFWMIFELLRRDYFYFTALRYGRKMMRSGGIKGKSGPWKYDKELFDLWIQGKTGVPFIDANMRELNSTGFMSARGRQNVASFLVNDLNVDWRMGGAYFESMLIDYSFGSNWNNWNNIAGVGNNQVDKPYYNILKQAQRYDPKGDYVRYWLPELRAIKDEKVHQVFRLSKYEQNQLDIHLGANYPWAITMPAAWIQYY